MAESTTKSKPKAKAIAGKELSANLLKKIPFSQLEIEPDFNKRLNLGDIDELSQDIAHNGVVMPLRVEPHPKHKDRYFVREGHRRFYALEKLVGKGKDVGKVPCIIKKDTPEQNYLKMLSGNSGLPFSSLERGLVYLELKKFGYEVKDIQEKFGIESPARIYDDIKLADSPKRLHVRIANGQISHVVALQILRESGDDWKAAMERIEGAVELAAKEAKKEGKVTKKATAKHVKGMGMTPIKALQEVVKKFDKHPDDYTQTHCKLVRAIVEVLENKGSVTELLALLKK
jgi:ParB/RepB/Spo0J family partition protein